MVYNYAYIINLKAEEMEVFRMGGHAIIFVTLLHIPPAMQVRAGTCMHT